MKDHNAIKSAYQNAKAQYAEIGINTDDAIANSIRLISAYIAGRPMM